MKNCTRVLRFVLCAVTIFLNNTLHAQSAPFTHQGLTSSTGDFLGFLQYKPVDYDQHPDTRYPVIIFLHGIGERGNGTTDLDNVAYVGLPRIIIKGNNMRFTWNGKTETFLVLAPQCPYKYGMWPAAFVNDLIAYAKQNLRIDTNRIFLTGLSMGGGGSLRYISDALPGNAQNLAAVATIAAPCTFRTGQYAAAAHLPVWCFHAEDDPTAPVTCTKNAIAGFNQWNLQPKPLLNLWPTGGHQVWDRVYTDTNYQYQGVLNIYEWFLGQNKSLPVNQLPIANAGADRSITGTTIVLDGSASSDVDGKLVRYVWKQLSGPGPAVITTPMGAQASTTVRGIYNPGSYTFELSVADDRASFSKDTVSITVTSTASPAPVPAPPIKDSTPVADTIPAPVKDSVPQVPPVDSVATPVKDTSAPAPVKDSLPASPKPNKGPVAVAGNDITLTTAWTRPLLNGTLSTDSDGWIVRSRWNKISGPVKYTLLDSTALQTRAIDLDTGVFVFRLTITDNHGATSSDDIVITVKPAPVVPPTPNIPPVANAGEDGIATLGWNKHILNSSLSKDKDGWITSVRWSKISGPGAYQILDSTALVTYATDLVEGDYIFRVKVKDNRGDSSIDDVKITLVKRITTASSSALVLTVEEKTLLNEGISRVEPNPTTNLLHVQYWSPAAGETKITVFDVHGRIVKRVTAPASTTTVQQSIDVHDLTSGMYFLVAQTGTRMYAPIKFVKQ